MRPNKQSVLGATVGVAALLMALPVAAATINFVGVDDTSNTASAEFNYDASLGQVSIDLTNTSTSGPDPRITGFTFNLPIAGLGLDDLSASGTGDDDDWEGVLSYDGINTPGNYGSFDIAGITGPNLNGGNADSGIATGSTGSFTFLLTGNGLDSLTTADFLAALSDPQNQNSNIQPFLLRFQRTGEDGLGSDVAVPGGGEPNVIPLPATLPMIAAALGVMGFVSRRRKTA